MKASKQKMRIWVVLIVMLIFVLACDSGYSFRSSYMNNAGQIVITKEAVEGDDRVNVEINDDYRAQKVTLDITMTVESGLLEAVFVDGNGEEFTLSAAGGNPDSGHFVVETDLQGNIDLKVKGQGAQGMKITINYKRE